MYYQHMIKIVDINNSNFRMHYYGFTLSFLKLTWTGLSRNTMAEKKKCVYLPR